MSVFYSPTTNAFYLEGVSDKDINGKNVMPADVRPVPKETFSEFTSRPPFDDGDWERLPDEHGMPMWSKVVIPFDELRDVVISSINYCYDAALEALTAEYPAREQAGWPEQLAAARRVQDGGDEPLINVLAEGRSLTASAMAATIIRKSNGYHADYGLVTAARHKLLAATQAISQSDTDYEAQFRQIDAESLLKLL